MMGRLSPSSPEAPSGIGAHRPVEGVGVVGYFETFGVDDQCHAVLIQSGD
jgi:hypothetical protein